MIVVNDFGCGFSKLISTKINRIFGDCVLEYTAEVSYITDIVFIALYFQLDMGRAVTKILLGVLRGVLCYCLCCFC